MDKKGDRNRVFLHKEWAVHPEPFPYQTAVKDITAFAPDHKNKSMSLTDLFLIGCQCFLMTGPQYGCQAEVSSMLLCVCACVHVCVCARARVYGVCLCVGERGRVGRWEARWY